VGSLIEGVYPTRSDAARRSRILHRQNGTGRSPTLEWMQVTQLWRYPVKSIGGEQLESASIDELGIVGDRGWGVFDVATGTVLTARRSPQLLFASARIEDGELMLTLPETGDVDERSASAALSRWLGQEVQLRKAGDEGGTYEAPIDFENDANWVSPVRSPVSIATSSYSSRSTLSVTPFFRSARSSLVQARCASATASSTSR
jgi:hypothetical protein